MAYPQVASITTSGGGTAASHVIDYPATGINSGDLLILIAACDGSGDTIVLPAGDFLDNTLSNANSSNHGQVLSYAFADGTENGTDFTVTLFGDVSEGVSAAILHITGAHASTPPEHLVTLDLGDNNTTPWPAQSALTPSGWTSSAEDTLWLAGVTFDNTTTTTINGYPTNFSSNQTSYVSVASQAAQLGFGTQELQSASLGYSAVTSAFSAAVSPTQFILAVRPAAAAGGATTPGIEVFRYFPGATF